MKTYLIDKGVKSYIAFMLAFSVVAVVTVTTRVLKIDDIQNIFKPMLMIILMLFVFVNTKLQTTTSKLIFVALLFSMFGDVFLMPYYDIFILGLASFLVAHIFYILAFLRHNNLSVGIARSKISVFILITSYLGLVYLLVSNMLKTNIDIVLIIAVIVYASVITFMVLTAISLNSNRNCLEKKIILVGAILFMISDAVIAINKFVVHVPLSGLWIMSLYSSAQWLITVGSIARITSKKKLNIT
jgi:uncharacterized membrane protein YhhN